jgi:hypothetical protein
MKVRNQQQHEQCRANVAEIGHQRHFVAPRPPILLGRVSDTLRRAIRGLRSPLVGSGVLRSKPLSNRDWVGSRPNLRSRVLANADAVYATVDIG